MLHFWTATRSLLDRRRHIRLAGENGGEIRLLLTDMIMPKMNGRDLAQEITTLCPKIKCLFMSGYTTDVIAHHGILDEGTHFIQKPFSIRDMATKVRKVLDSSEGTIGGPEA